MELKLLHNNIDHVYNIPTVYITNDTLYTISQNCPKLVYLHITSPETLLYDKNGLRAVIQNCKYLRHVYIGEGLSYYIHGYDIDKEDVLFFPIPFFYEEEDD